MRRDALYAFIVAAVAACDSPASVATPREPVIAGPSFAKYFDERFTISDTLYSPCQPQEHVAFQGYIHFHAQAEETPTGIRGTIHSNTQGIEGVGLASGDRYRGIENAKGDFEFSSPGSTFDHTFEIRLRLIRQGSADNLWSRLWWRFTDPPGTLQFIKGEIECRG